MNTTRHLGYRRGRPLRPRTAFADRFGPRRTPRIELLECRRLLAGDLQITEFMAANEATLRDEDGSYSDWIELHNPTAETISLEGWHLTDDPDVLDKWEFASLTVPSDGYLVVFASGKDRRVDSFRLVRDFNSTVDGTFVTDLPDGQYTVRVTLGDAERARDNVAVHVQGELVETLSTPAGAFVVWTDVAEVSGATGGQLAVRFEDRGGETAQATINALVITPVAGGEPLRFDFGTADSLLEPGYLRIAATDTYDPGTGYGWHPDTVVTDRDRAIDRDEPHTNFKLSAGGEYIALVSPAGVVVSEFGSAGSDYPPQITDVSFGIPADGGAPGYLALPTPGMPNTLKRSPAVQFDQSSRVFSDPLTLTLSTDMPGAVIHVRTNGTESFLDGSSPASYLIPTGAVNEEGWQSAAYDASAWSSGRAAIGFDTGVEDNTPGFTVRDVRATGPITSLAAADALLAGTGIATETIVTGVRAINYLDTGDDGHFASSVPFPGGGGDDFVIRATTTLVIGSEANYTFGVHADDGVRLRIDGQDVIVDDTLGDGQDHFGSVFLTAGEHDLELVKFQRGGAATTELFYVSGTYDSFSYLFQLWADRNRDFAPWIQTDVQTEMHDASASLYLRIPFTPTHVDKIEKLTLGMRYDDGFIVYLNGKEVARRNAPDSVTHEASATAARGDVEAVGVESIDITASKGELREGENVLAIQALNASLSNPDFLIVPELEAWISGPSAESPVYTGPMVISETTYVQAVALAPGFAPSETLGAWFVQVDQDLGDFTSNLPVVVLENFGAGSVVESAFQLNAMAIYEPDAVTGRTSLFDTPTLESRVGLKVRGSNSAGKEKKHYAVEARDEHNQDTDISPLGMPADSDWILFPPYDTDRALVANSLAFELGGQMGLSAVRTRFVEVYHNTNGGDLSAGDYQGVYVLMEKIKRGPDRVNVEELQPQDSSEPEVSGGWILKVDRADPEDVGFGAAGLRIYYVDPKEEDVTPEQAAWIQAYVEAMGAALSDPDPETGYAQYIDVDSWLNYQILYVLTNNTDFMAQSTYFSKDRGGKIVMGPPWDFDRSLGYEDQLSSSPYIWIEPVANNRLFTAPWYRDLFAQTDFWQLWVDRWFELRQTVFSEENIFHVIDTLAAGIAEAQARNFERWPASAPDGGKYAPAGLKTWEAEILHLKEWLAIRLPFVDSHFLEPPVITPADGTLTSGEKIVLSTDVGTVYYTTDNTDPRLPGGAIHPDARRFNRTESLVSGSSAASYLIPTGAASEEGWQDPGFADSTWSVGQAAVGFDVGMSDHTHSFTVRDVRSTGTVTNLATADALLSGVGVASETIVTGVPNINYLATVGDGHFGQNVPFPGGSGDDFVIEATTTLVVGVEGTYTFGVNTDDGVRLRIDGTDLIIYNGSGSRKDYFATVFLSAGEHDLELVKFQRASAPTLELFFAAGAQTTFGDPFQLVSDENRSFAPLLATDVQAVMHDVHPGLYLRIPFAVTNVDDVLKLTLRMSYDDGFVAYLNGVEVARRNAAAGAAYDAGAEAVHSDLDAVAPEAIDISSYKDKLREGQNILAIHGLNATIDDADFLIVPELEAWVIDEHVTVSGATSVFARVSDGDMWSSPSIEYFAEQPFANAANLRITEIHFNPHDALPQSGEMAVDNDEFEFIELMNVGPETIDLAGVQLVETWMFDQEQGVRFTFGAQPLGPGERLVVVENRDAFQSRYGTQIRLGEGTGSAAAERGEYRGKLSNVGERVILQDRFGRTIQLVDYGAAAPWPAAAAGLGSSLEIVDLAGDLNDPANWRASSELGGSPGRAASGPMRGDMNWSGSVDLADISGFVLGLSDPAAYEQTYGVAATAAGDIDQDGDLDFDDIDDFVAMVTAGTASAPVPSARAAASPAGGLGSVAAPVTSGAVTEPQSAADARRSIGPSRAGPSRHLPALPRARREIGALQPQRTSNMDVVSAPVASAGRHGRDLSGTVRRGEAARDRAADRWHELADQVLAGDRLWIGWPDGSGD